MAKTRIEYDASTGKVVAALDKLIAKETQLARAGNQSSRRNKRAQDSWTRSIGKTALAMTGIGSATAIVGIAVSTVTRQLESMSSIAKEAAAALAALADQTSSFAALDFSEQEFQRTADLIRSQGLSADSRGEGFATVQGLVSGFEDTAPSHEVAFEQGLTASAEVFKATKVGTPLAAGALVEKLGSAQGRAPGKTLRRFFAAGQAGRFEPADLVPAGKAASFISDPDLGAAAASILAEEVTPEQAPTYLKALGLATGAGRTGEIPLFQRQFMRRMLTPTGFFGDIAGAIPSQDERLQALIESGATDPDKAKALGFNEIRQAQAVGAVAKNAEALARRRELVTAAAAEEGMFDRLIAETEAERPEIAFRNELNRTRSLAADVRAGVTGDPADRARALERAAVETDLLTRGVEMDRSGRSTFFRARTTDAEGRLTTAGRIAETVPATPHLSDAIVGSVLNMILGGGGQSQTRAELDALRPAPATGVIDAGSSRAYPTARPLPGGMGGP